MATRGFELFKALEAAKDALRTVLVQSPYRKEGAQKYEDAVHGVADSMGIMQVFLVVAVYAQAYEESTEYTLAACYSPVTAEEICTSLRDKSTDNAVYEIRPLNLF